MRSLDVGWFSSELRLSAHHKPSGSTSCTSRSGHATVTRILLVQVTEVEGTYRGLKLKALFQHVGHGEGSAPQGEGEAKHCYKFLLCDDAMLVRSGYVCSSTREPPTWVDMKIKVAPWVEPASV